MAEQGDFLPQRDLDCGEILPRLSIHSFARIAHPYRAMDASVGFLVSFSRSNAKRGRMSKLGTRVLAAASVLASCMLAGHASAGAVTMDFGQASSFAFSRNADAIADVASGYVGQLSFGFADFVSSTARVYSGLDGAGALLGQLSRISVPRQTDWAAAVVSFSGTGESILISSEFAGFPWGDITINVNGLNGVSDVPEPSTWAMLIFGVAMVGFAARRSRAQAPTSAA